MDALTSTLQSILGQLSGECEVPLGDASDDAASLLVFGIAVECELIRHEGDPVLSDVSYWSYNHSDPDLATEAELFGPVCDAIQRGFSGRIDLVVFNCPVGPPP